MLCELCAGLRRVCSRGRWMWQVRSNQFEAANPTLREGVRTRKREASTQLSASDRRHTTCPCCSSAVVASASVTSTLPKDAAHCVVTVGAAS